MTDTQLLTLAIAVIVPLSLLLYSNSRITDAKETLRADIKALQAHGDAEIAVLRAHVDKGAAAQTAEVAALRAEMITLRTNIDAGFERLHNALKAHELEHHK